jgi:hypothetical protein
MRTSLITFVSILLTSPGLAARHARQEPRLPVIQTVAAQPLAAQVRRVAGSLAQLGSPLPAHTIQALQRAAQLDDSTAAVAGIQAELDPYCLLAVHVNPESRVKLAQGSAAPTLVQGDWRLYLVKVYNQAGITAPLRLSSPNQIAAGGEAGRDRWMDVKLYQYDSWVNYGPDLEPRPAAPQKLSGLEVEYRIVQVFSRDAGRREAKIVADVGQGTKDLGARSEADILFRAEPSRPVTVHVRDENGKPAMAMFTFRDSGGHTYPAQVSRLAPDFFFQPQVYRLDGETVRLPAGAYTVTCGRGPEYVVKSMPLTVGNNPTSVSVRLERWIDPSKYGWWSGDHHIHAAGCAHYTNPTAGVLAKDMIRHTLGEDLKVGCNLTWGPCFDYQTQFFSPAVDKVSQYPYLLKYDIEVSGFGSHESGHLCLLRLKEGNYPGGTSKFHWPKLGLSTLRWAKKQGAVCGPAHSGNGIITRSQEVPNYEIPPFDGIGANEYIMDVTHELPGPDGKLMPAVDFLSTIDTHYVAEMNMWYHTLNCGYRTRVSGETDFPCISGERVGIGRSYIKLDGKLDFDSWVEGIKKGRCYVSDGKSHLMDFAVNGLEVGMKDSEVRLDKPDAVHITARVAALLDEKPDSSRKQGGYWSLERARIGESRDVPLEVVVNGYPVAKQVITADGKLQNVDFAVKLHRSSWVALRILGASHTNPIFVLVNGKPIRASRRSAEWCQKSLEQCWNQKNRFYAQTNETAEAKAAYGHAREAYRRILAECYVD